MHLPVALRANDTPSESDTPNLKPYIVCILVHYHQYITNPADLSEDCRYNNCLTLPFGRVVLRPSSRAITIPQSKIYPNPFPEVLVALLDTQF